MTFSSTISRAAASVSKFSAHRPWSVLLAAIVIAGLSIVAASRFLTLNPDAYALLPEDVPFLQNYNDYKSRFTYDRRTNIVVIDAPSPELAETAQIALADRLSEDVPARFNAVRAPDAEPFIQRNGLLYLSTDALEQSIDRLAGAEPAIALLAEDPSLRGIARLMGMAKQHAAASPDVAGIYTRLKDMIATAAEEATAGAPNTVSWAQMLLGPDHMSNRRLVLVQGRLDGAESDVGGDSTTVIHTAAQDLGLTKENGIRLRLTGRGPLSKEEMTGVVADIKLAGTLSLILLAIVLTVGFRSWRAILACLATLLVGLAWTFGFATAAIGSLTLLSIVFSVLFIGLGIDFAIHFTMRFREESAEDRNAAETAQRSASSCGGSLALCAVTSAVGFLSFWPTDYRGLAELGVIAAAGMGLALAASLIVLPALLSLLRCRDSENAVLPFGREISVWIDKHRRIVAAGAGLIGLAAITVSSQTSFDFNSLALKDPKSESIATLLDLQADGTITPYSLSIPFDNLEDAERAAAQLRDLPGIARIRTPSELIPSDQDLKLTMIQEAAIFLWPALNPPEPAARADDDARASARKSIRTIAENGGSDVDKRLAAALDKLSEDATADLERRLIAPLNVLFARLVTALQATAFGLDEIPAELRSRYIAEDGGVRIAVLPADNLRDFKALGRFVSTITDRYPGATGRPVLEYGTGRIVVDAFLQAVATALVGIFAILVWRLRSVRDAILVLLPLILAGAATTAFGVLADIPFNVANVIVLPLVLGLGVDNGVHLVARWRETASVEHVLQSSTPRAVLLSGATTLASFATLAVAGNPGISGMGQLLAVAMTSILLSTMFVLPALLHGIAPNGSNTRRISTS